MGFSAVDNYSILNNYTYDNKPSWLSTLDWLSTPCRRILGGRNVNLLAETSAKEMTTTTKVVTLFFSIVIFPIAIISTVSFAVKLIALTLHQWEKKKVEDQCRLTWKVIEQFDKAFQDNKYDQAIQSLMQNPEIAKRSTINKKLEKIIHFKIDKNAPWKEIQKLLVLLDPDDANYKIDFAVKEKIAREFARGYLLIEANDIIDLINNSLKNVNAKLECCKLLIVSALQIEGDFLQKAIKMDLADKIINSITQLKLDQVRDVNQRMIIKNEEKFLRQEACKNNKEIFNSIFNAPEKMQILSNALQKVRNTTINQLGVQTYEVLNALQVNSDTSLQSQWDLIHKEFTKYHEEITKMTSAAPKEVKDYITSSHNHYENTFNLMKCSLESPTVDQVNELNSKLNESSKQNNQDFVALAKVQEFGLVSLSNGQDILHSLGVGNLLLIYKQLGEFLMKNMQTTIDLINKN